MGFGNTLREKSLGSVFVLAILVSIALTLILQGNYSGENGDKNQVLYTGMGNGDLKSVQDGNSQKIYSSNDSIKEIETEGQILYSVVGNPEYWKQENPENDILIKYNLSNDEKRAVDSGKVAVEDLAATEDKVLIASHDHRNASIGDYSLPVTNGSVQILSENLRLEKSIPKRAASSVAILNSSKGEFIVGGSEGRAVILTDLKKNKRIDFGDSISDIQAYDNKVVFTGTVKIKDSPRRSLWPTSGAITITNHKGEIMERMILGIDSRPRDIQEVGTNTVAVTDIAQKKVLFIDTDRGRIIDDYSLNEMPVELDRKGRELYVRTETGKILKTMYPKDNNIISVPNMNQELLLQQTVGQLPKNESVFADVGLSSFAVR